MANDTIRYSSFPSSCRDQEFLQQLLPPGLHFFGPFFGLVVVAHQVQQSVDYVQQQFSTRPVPETGGLADGDFPADNDLTGYPTGGIVGEVETDHIRRASSPQVPAIQLGNFARIDHGYIYIFKDYPFGAGDKVNQCGDLLALDPHRLGAGADGYVWFMIFSGRTLHERKDTGRKSPLQPLEC